MFVFTETGLGKTVASYKQLAKHISCGGFGLIISHQIVEQALTANHAIDAALRVLMSSFAPNAGADALLLCQSATPFLIVIEDINRSGRSSELMEKIAPWGQTTKGDFMLHVAHG